MVSSLHSLAKQRHDQIFPTLAPLEIERARRFGEVPAFTTGEPLVTSGQRQGRSHRARLFRRRQADPWPGQFLRRIGTIGGVATPVYAAAEGLSVVVLDWGRSE
jgi:hypothetical protein